MRKNAAELTRRHENLTAMLQSIVVANSYTDLDSETDRERGRRMHELRAEIERELSAIELALWHV